MSNRGYVAIARGFFDHPFFAKEPFTEREAFQWMIMEAGWDARRVRRGRLVLSLSRGEFAHSIRFMAAAWKWDSARVRRFLKRLKNDSMIEQLATRDATRITICNYNKYQSARRTGDTPNDPQGDELATNWRPKLEPLNHLTSNQEDEDAPSAVTNADEKYFFKGLNIRLSKKTYDSWQAAFPDIRLGAELHSLDEWAGQFGAKWFFPVKAALAKRNREAFEAAKSRKELAARPPAEIYIEKRI